LTGLVRDLAALVDPRRVWGDVEDLVAYTNDATHRRELPAAVVAPESVDEVAAVLRYANGRGIPVTPRGAGTGLAGGAVPAPGGLVLDLKRLNRILEIDDRNLTATVECGVVTGDFQREVEARGLFYPPDPQSLAVCTIGGNVATRAGGPRGVKYGTTKDYVLGLEAVLPDGSVISYGGKSVKMSAGYDLARVFTGSEGTLGVITKVTLRLLVLPPCRRVMVAAFPELDSAAEAVSALIARGAEPSMLEMLDRIAVASLQRYLPLGLPPELEAFLIIEVDGHPAKVEEDCALVAEVCREYGVHEVRVARDAAEAERILQARRALFPAAARAAPNLVIEDATVPRTQVPAMVRAIRRIAERHRVLISITGHIGDGNLHPGIIMDRRFPESVRRAEQAMAEIAREALNLGGTLSGEHGVGLLKAPFLEWEFGEAGVALMRRLKRAFDPHGIMNPGKILGGGMAGVRD